MNYSGRRALSEDECNKMIDALCGRYWARDRAIFQLMRRTGFRVSEITSLKIEDVFDRESGVVRDHVTVARESMKGRRESRTMPLHHSARQALDLHIKNAHLGFAGFSGWPLFSRQGTNKALSRFQILSTLHRAAESAGIDPDRIGTHSLRKTFASDVFSSPHVNGNLTKMSRLLGHRNPANTLRYIEFLDGSLEAAVLST